MKKLLCLIAPLALAACAGGGGGGSGGGGSSSGVTPFTSWSAVQPNSTVQATGGTSTYFDYSSSRIGPLANTSNSTFTGSYGSVQSDGYIYLTAATISPGGAAPTISFSQSAGDTIAVATTGPLAGIATGMIKADSSAVAIAAEPQPLGWNYQTYGIWVTGNTSGYAGATSVGSPTVAGSIPTTGSATFSGNASGFYLNSAGNTIYFTTANMQAVTNFATRSISFSTNTTRISPDLVTTFATPSAYGISGNLNMSGTLSYASGSNAITGSVTASGASANSLTGSVTGRFYGPSAQEIGGTYGLYNAGTSERLIGGFGGKR
jgi:hypothetical protein